MDEKQGLDYHVCSFSRIKKVMDEEDGVLRISLDSFEKKVIKNDAINFSKKEVVSQEVPESVLQYERNLSKARAAFKTCSPVRISQIDLIHGDDDIIVINKPSGVLCVPGVNGNPSILNAVYQHYGCESNRMDKMIVHRLDMDTSGVVIFARNESSLKKLHGYFRNKVTKKSYEALVCGHMADNIHQVEIDLPLQRDHRFPPFMRVSTAESEREASVVVEQLQHAGYKKLMKKNPKQSVSLLRVIERIFLYDKKLPVTRVELIPVTGRTHQLRVHCAAIGLPIVADPVYGIYGEGSCNGGLEEEFFVNEFSFLHRTSISLQKDIHNFVSKQNMCMCLHAKKLILPHPSTEKEITFECPTSF